MTKLAKIVLIVLGVVLAIPAVLLLCFGFFFRARSAPSNILNFHPTSFQPKATSSFFYSIGDDLKYGDSINPSSKTLLHGYIRNFQVSPDSRMIAVAANGRLDIIRTDGTVVRQLDSVDSIYTEPEPIGRDFIRDDEFQWSRDSSRLYFIKDQFYESKGSQLFSNKAELWMLAIDSGSIRLVVKPFPSDSYFFGRGDNIYFSAPTPIGDLELRAFDGNRIAEVQASEIAPLASQNPFASFSIFDMEHAISRSGISLHLDSETGPLSLQIHSRKYVSFTKGEGFKGSYYCPELLRSVFLPGDQYFMLDTANCENAHGKLVIDTVSGRYEVVPENTRIYVTLNSDTYPNYRINVGGLLAN